MVYTKFLQRKLINKHNRINSQFMKVVYILGLLFLMFSLSNCGYVSTSPYLKHINSITVPRVAVEDPELSYEYEDEFTEQLRDIFSSKWQEGNNSVLTVTIKEFEIIPIAFDATNNPEELQIRLIVDYTFEDRVRNEMIDQKEDYVYNYDFYIVEGKGEPPETVETATKRMVREFSRELFSNLAEQW